MAIYLVQHGISLPKDEDPERGLSAEGIREVKLIAGVAANYKISVQTIIHSGKKRARETAELLGEALHPAGGILSAQGLAPMDDVIAKGAELDVDSDMMLVGHLPFMQKLASFLVTGSTEFTPFKFQNGGIVCLDRDDEGGRWHVKWAFMPNIT